MSLLFFFKGNEMTKTNVNRKLIWEYQDAKVALEVAKDKEKQLRDEIVSSLDSNAKNIVGTTKYDVSDDLGNCIVKVVVRETITCDNASEVENIKGSINNELFENLFRKTYSLNKKLYDELDESTKIIVDSIITKKNGLPSIEVIA